MINVFLFENLHELDSLDEIKLNQLSLKQEKVVKYERGKRTIFFATRKGLVFVS